MAFTPASVLFEVASMLKLTARTAPSAVVVFTLANFELLPCEIAVTFTRNVPEEVLVTLSEKIKLVPGARVDVGEEILRSATEALLALVTSKV